MEIINVIPEYILTTVISAFLILAIKSGCSYVHAKALNTKSAHAKELWLFVDKVAETAVTSLVSADKSGDQKFTEATRLVQSVLDKQGFTGVDLSAIEAAVQAAYEKSPLTPDSIQHPVPYSPNDKGTVITPAGMAVAIDPKEA